MENKFKIKELVIFGNKLVKITRFHRNMLSCCIKHLDIASGHSGDSFNYSYDHNGNDIGELKDTSNRSYFTSIDSLSKLTKEYFEKTNLVGRYVKWKDGKIDKITQNINSISCLNLTSFGGCSIKRFFDCELEILPFDYTPETEVKQSTDFILPEKWYITVNGDEQREIYRKFFDEKINAKWRYKDGYVYGFNGQNYVAQREGGVEITFDQFKQYVLNDSVIKKFLPEYVECIKESLCDFGTNEIGKIYKVIGETTSGSDYLIEFNGKKYPSVAKNRFIKSTKKAYEAQFIKSEEWIPKTGDWVVITKSESNWANSMDEFDGKCVQITKLFYPGRIGFKDDGNWAWEFVNKHFRKATAEEITLQEITFSITTENTREYKWEIYTLELPKTQPKTIEPKTIPVKRLQVY